MGGLEGEVEGGGGGWLRERLAVENCKKGGHIIVTIRSKLSIQLR